MLLSYSEMLSLLNKVKSPIIYNGQIRTRWIAILQSTCSITRLWSLNVNGAGQRCPLWYLRTVNAIRAALFGQTG